MGRCSRRKEVRRGSSVSRATRESEDELNARRRARPHPDVGVVAIVVIWLAVLFTAIYGADIVDRGVPGDISTVPSGVAVALFASIATWPVAKYGLRNDAR